MSAYNKITKVRGRVEGTIVSQKERDKLVAKAEEILGNERYGWKANIDGFCIQLFTNSEHLYEFWIENWFSMDANVRSHGRIYAVMADSTIPPHAYYNPETKTAIVFNTEYYGQIKSWALGITCDIAEDQHDIHSIHGSCIEVEGKGIVLIAPTGTGKSTHSYALLGLKGAKLHSDDWLYVRFIGRASADISERKFYIRTNIVKVFPEIGPLLDKSKLENVEGDYVEHEYSRAMLDPVWMAGREKFVHTTRISKVFLLKRDLEDERIIRKLEGEEAVQYLTSQPEQFLNPYLIVKTREKVEIRKDFFRRLFRLVPCYLVNTIQPVSVVQKNLREIIEGDD